MLEVGIKKLALKCFALALLTFSLLLFSRDSTKALLIASQMSQEGMNPPGISITSQADVPLRILSTEVISKEPQNFKLRALVQNQSQKSIRAYAITSETVTSTKRNGYTQFANLTQRAGIWQPTEIKTIEVSDNQDGTIVGVRLTVDFIEFTDGSTCGPDTSNSRDMLAGQREGARVERERIRQLLKNRGLPAVAALIQTTDIADIEFPVESTHSQQWTEGFRSGAGSIRARLKQALQSADAIQVQRELARPFDTSEENNK